MITYTTPDGKQWEVVDVRKPKIDELFIDAHGNVLRYSDYESVWTRPIVRPIVPEWITPTDEDAKQRPMVEVRDYETWQWNDAQLLGVVAAELPYVAYFPKERASCAYKFCRMRNPEYKANP